MAAKNRWLTFKFLLVLVLAYSLVFISTELMANISFAPAAQGAGASQGPSEVSINNPNVLQAAHYDSPKAYTGERISLDFQNADIHNIIRIIGEVSGKNIVVSDTVTGKVTLKLKNVPWDQALDIVLATRNLGVIESGNVISVYDMATISNIRSTDLQMQAEREEASKRMPMSKIVLTPKYAPISIVKAELDKVKSARGSVKSVGNDIYIEDDPGSIGLMRTIFMRIDKAARQILIEARIIEATTAFTEQLGIKWGLTGNQGGLPQSTSAASGGGSRVPGKIDGGMAFDGGASLSFGFLNKANSLLMNAEIKASEVSSDTRVVSAPRIMAANDQEVSIKQGQQIPYTSGSSATTAANTSFKDVSMELKVKPHIEENGQIVTLDIELKNDTPQSSGGSGGDLAINTREAKTKLMVKDGETVVIGGIIVDSQTTGYDRVPGVYRLPLLGWLFQDKSLSANKSEMLIFITANIIPINI